MAAYEYVGRKFNVSADIVGAEMERIEKEQGAVTRENLLDAGRPEDSALHPLFEWDDSKAAELYRLKQATDVITHIHIKVTEAAGEPYRAYVNIIPAQDGEQTQKGRFINIRSAMENEETRKIVLASAVAEMNRFAQKYSKYTELAEVFDVIAKVTKKIKGVA